MRRMNILSAIQNVDVTANQLVRSVGTQHSEREYSQMAASRIGYIPSVWLALPSYLCVFAPL